MSRCFRKSRREGCSQPREARADHHHSRLQARRTPRAINPRRSGSRELVPGSRAAMELCESRHQTNPEQGSRADEEEEDRLAYKYPVLKTLAAELASDVSTV